MGSRHSLHERLAAQLRLGVARGTSAFAIRDQMSFASDRHQVEPGPSACLLVVSVTFAGLHDHDHDRVRVAARAVRRRHRVDDARRGVIRWQLRLVLRGVRRKTSIRVSVSGDPGHH